MLIAKNAQGELINLLEELPSRQKFYCPACQRALILKNGPVRQPHFAHQADQACQAWAENESAQHLSLKVALYDWARSSEEVTLEEYLPELHQTPDLLINQHLAIEIQCSTLSIERLTERSQTYHSQGYYVLWAMGRELWLKDRLTALQTQLLYFSQNLGFYYWELDLAQHCLRLKYLIHVNLRGQLNYLVRLFPFAQSPFLAALSTPFQACPLSRLPAQKDLQFARYLRQNLYYQNPKWLKIQSQFYLRQQNLLTKDPPFHWAPIGLDLWFEQDQPNFLQVPDKADLIAAYYQAFRAYYTKWPQTSLYPPAFYLALA